MNREDIIRIAQDAGLHIATDVKWMPIIGLEYAEKFAALVIANHPPQSYMTWQEGYEAGKHDEREAIAQMIEDAPALMEFAQNDQGGCLMCGFTPKLAAKTIRARGQA